MQKHCPLCNDPIDLSVIPEAPSNVDSLEELKTAAQKALPRARWYCGNCKQEFNHEAIRRAENSRALAKLAAFVIIIGLVALMIFAGK